MNIIDTTLTAEVESDPQMVITFLQYALDDVRKHSTRSAHLLEQAISALAQEAALVAYPQSLS